MEGGGSDYGSSGREGGGLIMGHQGWRGGSDYGSSGREGEGGLIMGHQGWRRGV